MRQRNRDHALVEEMDSPKVVGNRLYKIRFVAGFPEIHKKFGHQKQWADKIGLSTKSYSQWESGTHGHIPVLHAIKICEWTGNAVDLDYIYRGRPDDLGREWAGPLRDAPDRPSVARRANAPRRKLAVKRSRRSSG